MSARFKILQFNMQFGQMWSDADPDRAPIRLSLTIEEILSHEADLVLLQEVERAEPGGTQPPVPPNYTRLKSALAGYDSYFSFPREDPRELPFGIGLAIFSRTPLRDPFRLDLPSPPVEFDFFGERKTPTDRLLIGATTTIGGRDLRVLNTHLLALFMLQSSSEQHNQQRQLVAAQLRSAAGPTVLGGDFNVSRHESLVRQFGEAGFKTVQDREVTWRRRPYVLDHLFYNAPLRPVSHAVKPTIASDHHALVAEFEFAE
ncbi:endonuclease/exonuclease/phosphatase family protein [Oleiharenicola sp. Vm1]|uniref:endonuclease/exonuclease/phosphatase family protein n=1 Tax=Oleiharenicola sp. Vm1 TaxID=3398393 RepID=UPI0039F508A2